MTTTDRRAPTRRAAAVRTARARRQRRRRLTLLVVIPVVLLAAAVTAATVLDPGRSHDSAPRVAVEQPAPSASSATPPTTAPPPTTAEVALAAFTAARDTRWGGEDGFLGKQTGDVHCSGGRCILAFQGGTLVRSSDATVSLAQVDDPASDLVVVNKQRPLDPEDWAPARLVQVGTASQDLRPEAAAALHKLFAAAEKAGHPLVVHSAYRSYTVQKSTYEGWVEELGKAKADAESARAGYSEHQTGLALDVLARGGSCQSMTCFGSTAQASWLAKNAWRYGYVVRYPEGATKVTGYEYEPWHIRYVGRAVASDMHRQGITTLEAYLGLPSAPTY